MFFRNQSTMNDAQQNSTPDITSGEVQQLVVVRLNEERQRTGKLVSINSNEQNRLANSAIDDCYKQVTKILSTPNNPTVSDTNENHASPINRL